MIALAIGGNEKFQLSDCELKEPRLGYQSVCDSVSASGAIMGRAVFQSRRSRKYSFHIANFRRRLLFSGIVNCLIFSKIC